MKNNVAPAESLVVTALQIEAAAVPLASEEP